MQLCYRKHKEDLKTKWFAIFENGSAVSFSVYVRRHVYRLRVKNSMMIIGMFSFNIFFLFHMFLTLYYSVCSYLLKRITTYLQKLKQKKRRCLLQRKMMYLLKKTARKYVKAFTVYQSIF